MPECVGYDILLDEGCRPWLLEVNHSPSFITGSVLDCAVKEALLAETLLLVRLVCVGWSACFYQIRSVHLSRFKCVVDTEAAAE